MRHCLGRRKRAEKMNGVLKGYGVQLPAAPLTVKQPVVVIDFCVFRFFDPTHDNENQPTEALH
jgi:hypothetical protein